MRELHDWVERSLLEINARYPEMTYNPLAYSYLDAATDESPEMKLARYLHWERHRESLAETTVADATGNLTAWRKLARTAEDFRRAVYRLGGFKPFKGDVVHRQFLELVLCFEKERLTAEELADCADTYCGCGKTMHDADALRKQYRRLRKDLEASTPKEELK